MLNTTAGSPGETEGAAGSHTDAAMKEKRVVNEAAEQGWPGLHVGLLLHTPFQDAEGVLHAPGCQTVLAETRFLCASPTSTEQKCLTSTRWGHPDLRGRGARLPLRMQFAEAAEC